MPETVVSEKITLDPRDTELVRAGVHFGYAKRRRHPQMRKFIAGVKNNIEIFQLEKVREHVDRALGFLEEQGKQNSLVLWVGTKPAASKIIAEVATALGHPYVNGRWLGGTLTNFKIIRDRVRYWQDLVSKQKSGELEKYTKQEQLRISKEIERLKRGLEGILSLSELPKVMFVVDAGEEVIAVREARLKKISVVALINSDCDPTSLSYAIPGNDNASKSVEFIVSKAKEAYLRGKKEHGGN